MSSMFKHKSSKDQEPLVKGDVGSLGIQVQPIVFYPERNAYELRIELPDCPKDLIKVTYDRPSGKLKVEGENRRKMQFVHEVAVPSDCAVNEIYGRFRGDVLNVILPRSKADWHSKPALSNQEDAGVSSQQKTPEVARERVERDQKTHEVPAPPPSNHTTTEKIRQSLDKVRELAADIPARPPSYQKVTDRVKERVEKYQKLLEDIIAPQPSNPQTAEKEREIVEKDKKLPAQVPTPPPPYRKTTERLSELMEDRKSPAEVLAPSPPPDRKGLRESERSENDKQLPAQVPAPPPPSDPKITENEEGIVETSQKLPAKITTRQPPDQKTSEKVTEEVKKDEKSPADVPAPPSSDQKDDQAKSEAHQKDNAEGNLKRDASNLKPEKVVQPREGEKPSAGGKGAIATVKKSGRAALTAAMKEENRLLLVLGAAALAIAVIGIAAFRSSKKAHN